MKHYRISTTISQKHWELLKKHAIEYKTQQRTLEVALENLEKLENGLNSNQELSLEEKLSIYLIRSKSVCLVHTDGLKMMLETLDIGQFEKYVNRYRPLECALEFYFQKPLKECSIKEVIDGLVINARITNWYDTIDYTDNGDHYMLKFTHRLGLNVSEQTKISVESVLKTYGVKAESSISSGSVFIKIFKN